MTQAATVPTAHRTSRADYWLLAAIMALATAFRLPRLDRTSFWYDEAVSWSQSNGSLHHLLTSVAADNYPPLHNIVLWVTMKLTGDSETALRFPSAAASIMAVLLIFKLGQMLFGAKAGLLAAFLLATSPFHLWYASEARMYALFDAFGLAMLVSIVMTLRTGQIRWLIATVLCTTAFLYSHIYALFAVASIGCVLAVMAIRSQRQARKPLLRMIAALTAAGILFFPWLVVLVARARDVGANGFWIGYPDLRFLIVMVRDMAGSEWLFLLFLTIALAGFATFLFRRAPADPKPDSSAIAVVIAAAAGPALIAYILSVTVQPILFDRYLIAAWSAFLVLAAGGAVQLTPRFAPLALAALTLYLAQDRIVFALSEKIRPEWRTVAAAYLDARLDNAPIILTKAFALPALAYYVRENASIIAADKPEAIGDAFSGHTEIWLLIAHSNHPEAARAIAAVPGAFVESARFQNFGWGYSGLTLIRFSAR